MRQIVLDTETTGLETRDGHRVIEIGCVELVNRRRTGRQFHEYLQPDRVVDEGAIAVHGITNEFLADKPRFRDIADDFLAFVEGAELVIHNAPFDVGFLDHELRLLEERRPAVADLCRILDTLILARERHPGQRNSLDALCKRYGVDNSRRELHGALLDADILADVYLTMTGGQTDLALSTDSVPTAEYETLAPAAGQTDLRQRPALRVVRASATERAAHERCLDTITQGAGKECLWRLSADE